MHQYLRPSVRRCEDLGGCVRFEGVRIKETHLEVRLTWKTFIGRVEDLSGQRRRGAGVAVCCARFGSEKYSSRGACRL